MALEKYLLGKLDRISDDAIVHSSLSKVVHTKFVNNKIITTKSDYSKCISVFVSIKKRLVSTSLKQFSKKSADSAVRDVLAFSRFVEPNPDFLGIAEGHFKYRNIPDTFDSQVRNLRNKEIVENTIGIADSNGCRCSGVFEVTEVRDKILTSNDVEASDKGTALYLSARCFKGSGSGHSTAVSRIMRKFDYVSAAQQAAQLALDSDKPEKVSPGKYDVIFRPLSFSNIINFVGEACSIFNVESGLSCFKDKLGKNVASNVFSLSDDGSLPNGLASAKYDAEGRPTQNNNLIDHGHLRTYLHNTSTAKKYGVKPTASAGIISPAPHNLVVDSRMNVDAEGSGLKYDELVAGVKRGIVVTNTWYTRFQNYESGEFSTLPRDAAFLVENGKIVKPIKNIRVSENLLNLLSNVSILGDDSRQNHSWDAEVPVVTPSCLVKNIRITMPE